MRDYQVRAWLAVVDGGSIRGAARSLGLTQAAVTRAVRELEDELQAPLVQRSSRGVAITEFGHTLTVRLQLARTQVALAFEDIACMRGGKGAHVRFAATPMVMFGVLPGVLETFRRAFPKARLTVEEGLTPTLLPALRQGAIDFALAALIPQGLPSDTAFEPLQRMETMVAVRRGHRLAGARRWEDLLDCEWLMHLAPGSQHRCLLDTLTGRGVSVPRRIVHTNTFGVSWALLTGGDAVTTLPAGMLALRPYGEQIVQVSVDMELPPLTLGILSLRDTPLSFAATRLAQMFREALNSAKGRTRPPASSRGL